MELVQLHELPELKGGVEWTAMRPPHVEEVGLAAFAEDHPNLCYPYLPHCR